MTTNIALNTPAYNSTAWDVPLNYNATILDNAFGATTTIALPTGGVSTYTSVPAPNSTGASGTSQCMRINLTGALAANQLVLLPQGIAGMWVVTNSTTNSYTVTLGSNNGSNASAGSTVALAQGYSTLVYCDGVNVGKADDAIAATSGVASFRTTLSGLTPSTATTGVITLAGTLGAASGGTGLTAPGAIGNVLTSNGSGAWISSPPIAGTYTAGNGITIASNTISMSGNYTSSLSVVGLTTSAGLTVSTGNITVSTGTISAAGITSSAGLTASSGNIVATTGSISGVGITSSNGLTVSSGNLSVSGGSITANTNITATTGNITASAGSITANTNITATTGDVKATAGKVIAGNTNNFLQTTGTSPNFFSVWQVNTNSSMYYEWATNKFVFNPNGVNGVLSLTTAEFVCTATPKANQTSWTLISDRTEKRDISPVTNAVQRIMALNPVNFTWIKTEKADSGFIAQEFETVYPNNVQTIEDGKKGIAINMNIYADLVSTIQELHKKVEELESRLAAANV